MSFNQRQLRDVKNIAKNLIILIDLVQQEIEEEDRKWVEVHGEKSNYWRTAAPSKTTGELRRRSMDLTRALADLRKS